MPRRYSVVCDDSVASEIHALSDEYRLPASTVIEQLIRIGLEEVESNSLRDVRP